MKKESEKTRNDINKAALFTGCTARYLEPELGKAIIRVLLKNGINPLFVDQKCCATPKLSCGDRKGFIKYAEHNIRSLYETGCDIVTGCTSCALTLKQDYPEILMHEKSSIVAKRTYDIMEYLVMLGANGRLNTGFQSIDLNIYYHAPCHLRALGTDMVDERIKLIRLIPGLTLASSKNGWCCGMGGTFGLKKTNYEMSMTIGYTLFERIKELSPAIVVTECPMCKMQIEQGTGMQVIHPVMLISRAYGL